MRKAVANQNYQVLGLDEDGNIADTEYPDVEVDQYQDDLLELWKTRKSDGFHFVYCNRLEIGYWVMPTLVTEVAV